MSALKQGQFISIWPKSEADSETQTTVSGIILSEDLLTSRELFLYEDFGSVRVRGFATRMEYRIEVRGDFFEIEEEFRATAKSCKYSGIPFPMEAATFHEICSMLK